LKSYGFSFIKEVGTITNRKSVRIGGCLVHLNRSAILVNITLFSSKNMLNVATSGDGD
jgi:hypothetical protein